ncbi:MAG: hypothetical protein SYC29_03630 [Planctomycetota bacterium]|nr:hypothetical protein [Planctomycetota bacterium]
MTRAAFLLVIAFMLSGCQTGADGRVPFARYDFWRGAAIRFEPWPGESDSPEVMASVVPGDQTVLALTEGYARGSGSSAHSSHESFYFALPSTIQPGDQFDVDPADGTFAYDRWGGWFWYAIDSSKPAMLHVEILDVQEDRLVARVLVDLPVLAEPEYRNPERECVVPGRVQVNDVFTLHRRMSTHLLDPEGRDAE